MATGSIVPELSHERLTQLLDYDPSTGIFRWKQVTHQRIKVGAIAGTPHIQGYWAIKVDGYPYLAHRLVWLYVHGEWPPQQIDHLNHDRRDNRIANLRMASNAQNCAYTRKSARNTSGFKGVCARRGKWQAQIGVNYRIINLGIFATPELAHAAYIAAAKRYYGEFAHAG